MSLDVYLETSDGKVLYLDNITHNLVRMANVAGLYECIWRPDKVDIITAHQLIEPLSRGIVFLSTHRKVCEQYTPNVRLMAYGNWENLYDFCCSYLKACTEYPLAIIRVS